MSLTFECSQLVFSFPLTPEINFLFFNIHVNLVSLTEMCEKLLYPYSQMSEDVSRVQPKGCFQVECLSLGQGICLGEGRGLPPE